MTKPRFLTWLAGSTVSLPIWILMLSTFGQLMSGAKQVEFCFVTVQFEKVLSQPDVDFVDAVLNPGKTVEFGV